MPRVAYVCADPGVPVFGMKGASVHVQEVVRALKDLRADVTLFASRLDGKAPSDLGTVPVRPLPAIPKGDAAMREQAALAANEDLREALRSSDPFDIVYERYSLFSFAGMEYARESGISGILEVNAPLIEEQQEHRELANVVAARQVAREAFSKATQVHAVSEPIRDWVQAIALEAKVRVVPNGVNTNRFRPGLAATLPAPEGTFTAGFVGTLKPWHGVPILLEAFEAFHREQRDTRLLIVGDGPEKSSLEEDAARRGIAQAIHFAGGVPPEEVPGLLASMDVTVAPYPELSGFYFSPLKVYEYMAMGLPVIAGRIGELSRVIRHRENGILYAPGVVKELAAALALLKLDEGLRKSLGANARETIMNGHTWECVARLILQTVKPRSEARVP